MLSSVSTGIAIMREFMNIEEWINSPKTIKKSHKRYAHFDYRTDIKKVWDYISIPENIAHHSFYPFIHYKKDMSKFSKKYGIKHKERDICYASHRDSCVYQYYCHLLDEEYKKRVLVDGINEVAVAYRTNMRSSNITLAKRAFDFIRANKNCYVMIGDFTQFFDRLDHKYLKERWKDLLSVDALPKDHYAVFKNITKYSSWELNDLLILNGYPCNDDGRKQLNKQKLVLTATQFDANRSHICKNPNPMGIPQGSPISALLANVYMLVVDKLINCFVTNHNGFYMRYSDDFIVVMPNINECEAIDVFSHTINEFNNIPGIKLQHEKTQFFYYEDTELLNCGNKLFETADCDHRFINFLGFTFDGKQISIRSKTISKYYYRMRRKAKTVFKRSEQNGHCSSENLYKQYSERGSYSKNCYTGNFLTYVKRAKKCFGTNEAIDRDTKRHMAKIRKAISHPNK